MQAHILRYKLIQVFEDEIMPLNTCQICRLINGASHKNEIAFCTSGIKDSWTDNRNFAKHGNHAYRNCRHHNPNWKKVYSQLRILEKKGFIESRLELRRDPIEPNRKDRMRMWAFRGILPSLKKFSLFCRV